MSTKSFLKYAMRAVVSILVIGLPIVTAIFIAGPDAVRSFPKVPAAISETVNEVRYQAWLGKQLTGKWDNRTDVGDEARDLLAVELWVDGSAVDGEISAPAYIGKWRPKELPKISPSYPTALLRGEIEGKSLKVNVFDFVDGKEVKFANLKIRFEEEEGLVDFEGPIPRRDITELRIETEWEVSPAFPTFFTLFRTRE